MTAANGDLIGLISHAVMRRLLVKPGDLVRQRDMGMRGQERRAGFVIEIRKKSDVWQKPSNWKGDDWDSVKVYWGAAHKMNDRWMVRGSLEVVSEGR